MRVRVVVIKRLLFVVAIAVVAFALGVALISYVSRERPATTPLARAAQQGDASSVEGLIARGEDVNARDDNGYVPLAYAARAGDTAAVGALLDAKADPNARDCNHWGWTPLLHALHKYHDEAARALVERGADVNGRAGDCGSTEIENGVTPLMFAAKYDNAEMVKFLLEHGADARARYDGYNALSFAVAGGSLGRLSDIDRAATHPCPVETVKLLLKAAPDASLSDGVVDRAVLYVARKKCPEIARLLENRQPAREGERTNQAAASQPVAHH
jgi:ankyrin repeat protein